MKLKLEAIVDLRILMATGGTVWHKAGDMSM